MPETHPPHPDDARETGRPGTSPETACPTLEADGVRLRLHRADDVPAVVETSNDPVSVYWTTVPQPYGTGEAEWWVGHMREEWAERAAGDASRVMGWAIDARDEAGEWTFAGQVEVRPIGGGVGELGLVLHPALRGRGLMVRAGRLAMLWATEHGGLSVLHWKTAVGNWASRRVGWRLGFRFSDAVRGLMPQERATFDGWVGTWRAGEPTEPVHPWNVPAPLEAAAGADASGRPTAAVRLRAWTEDDRPATDQTDELGERFMSGMVAPSEPEAYTEWLTGQRTRMALGEMVGWAIVDPVTDEVAGAIQLFRLGHPFTPGTAELAYWLFPRGRGRGLVHAALVRLTEHAFTPAAEGGLGLARISARCDASNHGSAEALQRAGFDLVGVERDSGGRGEALDDRFLFELVSAAEPARTPGGARPQPPAPRPAAVARARDARVLTAPTLTGEDLVLRTWREDDLPALADAFARGSLGEYVPDAEGTRHWLRQRRERMVRGTDVVWAVEGAPGTAVAGQLLGGVNAQKLADRFAPHAVEIGYWTHIDHRGQDVPGRALELLLPHLMAPVCEGGLGRTQVDAVTHDDNLASQRVLMKAGFERVGERAPRAPAPADSAPNAAAPVESLSLRGAVDDGSRRPRLVDWRLDAGQDRAEQARRHEERRVVVAELAATTGRSEELALTALSTDEADLERVVEACRDPESIRWLGGPGIIRPDYSRNDAEGYAVGLANGALTGTWVGWAIREDDGRLVGMIDVQGLGEAHEIGYWVHPDARGRGIVGAALRAVVRHALTPRADGGLGLPRLFIRHAVGNAASQRAIEAAGFRRIGTARRSARLGDGSLVDHVHYDLLPEDLEGPAPVA
ncbi:GNAT family N-acetyltransferase [Kytococcus sp. Marseille-QA3725]